MPYRLFTRHIGALLALAVLAILVNSSFYVLSGIPQKYNQSSDATVHIVQWQEFSRSYAGNFNNDVMFQNYQGQPTGTLAFDRGLVWIAEALHIDLLDWSIIISWLSLALFLSGVYALVLAVTKKRLLAFAIAAVSIIPVISLGLSSWGFLTMGFVPKEVLSGVAVWLTLLYISGVETNSKKKVALFFVLLGLFSNLYPVLFFHYALILLGAEVLRHRAIKIEQVVYGLLFLAAAPVSLYDIFIKAAHFAPPVTAIILDHYTATLHSWSYLLFHYLRKQIIYVVLVGGLWYVYRTVAKKEYPPTLILWFAIWWSALVLSLIGVGVELWAPLYAKYMLSRASVWFYPASMILIGYTAYELYFARFKRSLVQQALFGTGLILVLLAQTSVVNVYQGIGEMRTDAASYQQYLSVVTKLQTVVPLGALVLSNPDSDAKTIRAYGGVGVYVSYKDGNVTLFDGDAATQWLARYRETQQVFLTRDFSNIQKFGSAHHLQYYLFDTRDITSGKEALKKDTVLQSGTYGLARLY